MIGPDLPASNEGFTVDVWRHRWPTGAEKSELVDGVPVFHGRFDQRDVEIAQSAYPGRQVLLNEDGGIEVHPSGSTPARPLADTYSERGARRLSRPSG
ncbi:hypothetical protein [Amycolatopsis nigrescens]|uniref:hypothetical protein n=1 Tax=Amycolatopsis nigrescens TaxID=381445 RepID=UPI0003663C76|nr:hypothetical protein [Amycolatopsis nigrescens]